MAVWRRSSSITTADKYFDWTLQCAGSIRERRTKQEKRTTIHNLCVYHSSSALTVHPPRSANHCPLSLYLFKYNVWNSSARQKVSNKSKAANKHWCKQTFAVCFAYTHTHTDNASSVRWTPIQIECKLNINKKCSSTIPYRNARQQQQTKITAPPFTFRTIKPETFHSFVLPFFLTYSFLLLLLLHTWFSFVICSFQRIRRCRRHTNTPPDQSFALRGCTLLLLLLLQLHFMLHLLLLLKIRRKKHVHLCIQSVQLSICWCCFCALPTTISSWA